MLDLDVTNLELMREGEMGAACEYKCKGEPGGTKKMGHG
jgi:hypothetical protein